MTRRHAGITFAIAATLLAAPGPHAAAQAGIPGSRLDTGRDHRAAAHAEAYLRAAAFFDRWKSAWDARDANTLIKLYADDASVRLPDGAVVRTSAPIERALREQLPTATPLTMADVDFHVSAETAALAACYYTTIDGRPVSGLVTNVLQPAGRSWRIRIQLFDPPRAAGSGADRFAC